MDTSHDSFFDDVSYSQEDVMNELLADEDRIRSRMEQRRAQAIAQAKTDEVKATLCNKIQAEKAKVPGLQEQILALEHTQPELFRFIRKLEYIQEGIWCPTCNKQKSIGIKPKESMKSSDNYETVYSSDEQRSNEQCSNEQRSNEQRSNEQRSKEQSSKEHKMLNAIKQAQLKLNSDIKELELMLRTPVQSPPQKNAPTESNIWKKVVISKPEYDTIIDNAYEKNMLSANDLLGELTPFNNF
jgi:hypothetical protein